MSVLAALPALGQGMVPADHAAVAVHGNAAIVVAAERREATRVRDEGEDLLQPALPARRRARIGERVQLPDVHLVEDMPEGTARMRDVDADLDLVLLRR